MAGPARRALNQVRHDPGAFVASVGAHFDRAAARAGLVEHDYRIARRVVRVRFAGSALQDALTAAFAHRRCDESASPDVTVDVFDSESTRTPLPAPPWSWDAYRARGDIDGYNTKAVRVAFAPGASALSVFDADSGRACWWVPDAARLPASEQGAPLRTLVQWSFESHGLQLVHGASVGIDGRGVLLVGGGGSGKSSSALACLQAGWSFVGDDYCLVESVPGRAAYSVYCTAKLDDTARDRLPSLAARPATRLANRDKWLFTLWPEYSSQLVAELPIDAVLVPRVDERSTGTCVRPARTMDVVRALATSTLRQLPGAGAPTWQAATDLVRAVPSHVLELAPDVEAIPDVIGGVLSHAGTTA
jgi:hypothetical protein